MLNNFKAIALLCVVISAPLFSEGQDWVTIKVDSLVSISFPGQPKPMEQIGKEILMFKDGTGLYMIFGANIDLPEAGGREDLYKEVLDGMFASGAPKNAQISDITIHGLYGKQVDYKINMKNGPSVKMITRIITVNGRVYGYYYGLADTVSPISDAGNRFLNSFTLAPGKNYKQFRTQNEKLRARSYGWRYQLGRILFYVFLGAIIFLIYKLATKKRSIEKPV